MLCISVKLKNLKANHNITIFESKEERVVYIRKVKKSESKSQHKATAFNYISGCVYP